MYFRTLSTIFLYIFWRTEVCRPLLCLCRPFMIFESCLNSILNQSQNFLTSKELKNRFQGTSSARLCILSWVFKKSMGARHRVGIGLSYRPAMLHRLAELMPWHRFLGSIKV
jgi:hypothetical protein